MVGSGDLVILGAGLAGLSTAIEALEAGHKGRVTILEAAKRPNELHPGKVGAGVCSGSGGLGLAMLKQIGWTLPDEVVMARINRAVLRGPTESVTLDGASVGLDGEVVGVVTNKHKFGDWLLDRATKLGAEYLPGHRVNRISRNGGWTIGGSLHGPTKDGEVRDFIINADYLVGADGPDSLTARQLFHAPAYKPEDCFTASEVYLHLKSFPNDQIDIHFLPSAISGYFWKFSASTGTDGLAKIGCGFTLNRGQNPSALTTWYREREAAATGDAAYLGKPVRYIGGRISGSRPLSVVCDPRSGSAVAGEAGRMVMASIGAGDSMAIESGRSLGKAIAEGRLNDYQRYYRANLYPYLRRHYRVKNALLSLNDDKIDRALRLLKTYQPRSTNTRKEVVRLMRWFLIRDPFLLGVTAFKAILP